MSNSLSLLSIGLGILPWQLYFTSVTVMLVIFPLICHYWQIFALVSLHLHIKTHNFAKFHFFTTTWFCSYSQRTSMTLRTTAQSLVFDWGTPVLTGSAVVLSFYPSIYLLLFPQASTTINQKQNHDTMGKHVFCFTGKLRNLSEISWFVWVFWLVLCCVVWSL